ncbi:MAG TPA: CPBP family intramembrane glutamic endopeptidase [Oligoflexus sp.]|uniref:CPBP family intramembrane glutamic endopeptidase n=1 Tax=Oligoflexus sp. TaxID=1971216 RepID=UPI002D7ECD40|nr:CPBP family intramembrane glutamic endopeptidase [Oligoflexus sp.]HET9241579.1 CPBP family intramembrane glutamic endopeptidase [Oligoflexus sp.]
MRETLATSSVLLRYGWRSTLGAFLSKQQSLTLRALMVFSFSYMPLMYFYQNYKTLKSLGDSESLQILLVDWKLPPAAFVATSQVWSGLPQMVWLGISVILLAIFFVSILAVHLTAYRKEGDPDLEWMQTFPITTRSILWGRLLQSTMLQPYFFLLVLPILLCFAIVRGENLAFSIVTASLIGWMVMLGTSSLGMIFNCFVSLRLTAGRQRDIRFLATFLLIAAFFSVYFPYISHEGVFWRTIFWMSPFLQDSLAIHFMERLLRSDASSIIPLLSLLAGVLVLAHGSVVISAGIVARGSEAQDEPIKKESRFLASLLNLFNPIVRRELRTLIRDRSQWATLMTGPLLALAFVIYNSFGIESLPHGRSFLTLCLMLYILMIGLSLQMIFQRERPGLWFYAATPVLLSDVLRAQSKVASVLFGLVYAVAFVVFVPSGFWQDTDSLVRLPLGLYFALTAEKHFRTVALLSYAPARENTVVKPLHFMIWLALTPALTFLVLKGEVWSVGAFLILFTGLAHTFEKKVLALEHDLIDPSYPIPCKADLAQGFLAALIYVCALMTTHGIASFFNLNLSVQFLTAAVTLWGLHCYYSACTAEDVPVYFAAVRFLDLLFLGMGCAFILRTAGLWDRVTSGSAFLEHIYSLSHYPAAPATAVLLFIVIARSVTEELIFRGLIQRGLASRMAMPLALIISAGLTTLCHKPQDFGPIFLTSLGSGFLYHRTKILWPGIALAIAVQSLRLFGF